MIEKDLLASLEPYFKEEICVDDIEKVSELHGIFHKDFFEDGVKIDGEKLIVKPYLYTNSRKDSLPVDYEKYYEKFVHIITREVKASNRKMSPKVRAFSQDRANRIHWIKPILENCEDRRITRFKHIESNGREREYFWYRDKRYIVIVEYILPDYALITGFCVDAENQPYYQNKYINRVK